MLGIYVDSNAENGKQEFIEIPHNDKDLIEVYPAMGDLDQAVWFRFHYAGGCLVDVVQMPGETIIYRVDPTP